MKKLSEIIPKVVEKRALDSSAKASEVLFEAEKHLKTIFGNENVGEGKHIRGKKLQQGLLFFDVSSAAWNNRLFMEKMELLEILQNQFPKMTLKDIRGIVSS